jgi:hypothetical protein
MLSRSITLIFFLVLTSCSLFKTHNVQDKNVVDLLAALQGVGEGRGRLGIRQNQYLFSYDAILKENADWLLAAMIPVHGEEVLILPNLKVSTVTSRTDRGLENRIEKGISDYLRAQKKSAALTRSFIQELRSIMRLILHRQLGLTLKCSSGQSPYKCTIDEVTYEIKVDSKQISINKKISDEYQIEFVAQNLTESFFSRSSFFLHTAHTSSKMTPLLSLELFWK